MDYHWKWSTMQYRRKNSAKELSEMTCRERAETVLAGTEYDYLNYLCYCLYFPLWAAGPIITFNDFMNQVRWSYFILVDESKTKIHYYQRDIFLWIKTINESFGHGSYATHRVCYSH